ncbi:hypothetical protein AGLY_007290 [Aphis glycines]|uniref:Uncharacterized protein n=1 Tax=Aphis glycines TaxID=307491 RepID=A0A6G0TPQ3_APHGL|nr:hypothetical protein AGLY_007290 [Aphis glycines]
MKFVLNVVALAVSVSLLWWMPPVQPFSTHEILNNHRELVLMVAANDLVWSNFLDVGIKFNTETLSPTAKEVLEKVPKITLKSAGEQQPEYVGESSAEGHIQSDHVLVRALHIVVDVATHYNQHGAAIDFALHSIVTAIKCKAFMFVLMQLEAIEKNIAMQNEVVTTQPKELWWTMVRVLDKVAVLNQYFTTEYHMYQQWDEIAKKDMTKELPPKFSGFKSLVMDTLKNSCELSTFEEIHNHMKFNSATENFNTSTGLQEIFKKCQTFLTNWFHDIPINTMKLEVWENVLNKTMKESSESKESEELKETPSIIESA